MYQGTYRAFKKDEIPPEYAYRVFRKRSNPSLLYSGATIKSDGIVFDKELVDPQTLLKDYAIFDDKHGWMILGHRYSGKELNELKKAYNG